MAEFIKRETALKIIDNYGKTISRDCIAVYQAIRDIVDFICPSADVVEVVRCCDCRYSDVYGKNCFCEYDPIETKSVSPNGYCSYGERQAE